MKLRVVLLLASAAFVGAASSALAADLPVKAARMEQVSGFSWTGFYLGANVGYGWGKANATGTLAGNGLIPTTSTSDSVDFNGIVGGGQIGYNWQINQFVLGVEADIQGSGESKSDTIACGAGCSITNDAHLDSFATVRGRIGFTPWDRTLLYFTGGYAWMHGKDTVSATAGGATGTILDMSASKGGWTIGGGWEQMLWDRWSAKIEYLYMRADDFSGSATVPAALGGGTVNESGTLTNNVIRVGLNYHF